MGLDMYLTGKRYVSTYREEDAEIEKKLREVIGTEFRVKWVDVEVGYWRKANAIHKWFVDNVQNGEDDCRPYDVSKKDCEMLLEIVNEVLENPEKANDLLPAQEGFFFGSTDYDEYYKQDLEDTKNILTKILSMGDDWWDSWYIEYQSSW